MKISKEKLIEFVSNEEFAFCNGVGRDVVSTGTKNEEKIRVELIQEIKDVRSLEDITEQLRDNFDDSIGHELQVDITEGCRIIEVGGSGLFIAYFD
jgi:hypothetical protein